MSEIDDAVALWFGGRPLLSAAEVALMEREQKELFAKWHDAKQEDVVYLGESIHVERGVFPPRPDSLVLAQSMDIMPGEHVLDIGTGTGVLSVIAGIGLGWNKGNRTGLVAATDVSGAAIRNARRNMEKFAGLPGGMFCPFTTDRVFPEDNGRRFDLVVANLPFRRMPEAEFSQSATMREVQRTMWDLDFGAHRTVLGQGQNWLTARGRMLVTVANYPDAREVMQLIRAHQWRDEVLGRGEFYACPKDDLYGVPLAVACLRLCR